MPATFALEETLEATSVNAADAIGPVPGDEAARLAVLSEYCILDTPPEQAFDDLARLAAQICKTPIALICFLDAGRQWFKSMIGLADNETAWEQTFCSYTILQNGLFTVPDALADQRFADSSSVIAGFKIRFYAGMPLITAEGYVLGTLCVADHVPRRLGTEQRETLRSLAHQVMTQLELRRRSSNLARVNEELNRKIAEHKQTEHNLHESEQRFQKAFNASPDPMIISRLKDGSYLDVNQSFLCVTGYTRKEVIGRSTRSLNLYANPEDGARLVKMLKEKRKIRKEEVSFRLKSGEVRTGLVSAEVIEIGGEKCLLAHTNDITELRRAEEAALHESEKRFRAIFDKAVLGIACVNTQGQVVESNRALQQMLGYTAEELRRMTFTDFTHPQDIAPNLDLTRELIDGKRDHFRVEKRYLRKDGSLMWGNLTVALVRDVAGEPHFCISTVEDITERKRAEEALRGSEERYRLLFATNPQPMLVFDIQTLAFLAVNDAAVRHYGYSQDEFLAMSIIGIHPPEDVPALLIRMSTLTAGLSSRNMWRHRRKDGSVIDVEVSAHQVDFAGSPSRLILANDVTERKQAEEALRHSEERFRLLVDGVKDYSIYMLDVDGRVASWNAAAERIQGFKADEILGQNFTCFYSDEEVQSRKSEHTLKVAAVEGRFEEEGWRVRKDGTRFWADTLITALHDETGGLRGFSNLTRDITERKRAEEQVLHKAFHDTLTGLPNRALFMDHLRRSIARTKRHDDYLFAVLFLDLDRFKLVNDSLGHVIGDQLLIATARMLERCLRPQDIVARLGGDEFTILIDDIKDVDDVTRVANRIHKSLAIPFNPNGHDVFTSASIGMTMSSQGYDRPEDCLRDADTAMYRAKALGKARHVMFDPSMHAQAVAQLKLETDLRRAVKRQEFQIHYQPIVSLHDNTLTGFEALVRWRHSKRGLVGPVEFIPVAEETGLIIPIGQWVLREACHQMRAWQMQFGPQVPLAVSVNLSSKQFSQPNLIEEINEILHQTGLDPGSLKLEITESVIMENAESATAMLLQLRALGVKLHIDDFGTGYSSLSYLHHFPVDMLKIDRSFVSRMSVDEENSEIVRTIVQLAHNLGMEVMAEGVETVEQLAQLRALKCEYGQGFLFSKPVDVETARGLIIP